jgi:hypothetical protein
MIDRTFEKRERERERDSFYLSTRREQSRMEEDGNQGLQYQLKETEID